MWYCDHGHRVLQPRTRELVKDEKDAKKRRASVAIRIRWRKKGSPFAFSKGIPLFSESFSKQPSFRPTKALLLSLKGPPLLLQRAAFVSSFQLPPARQGAAFVSSFQLAPARRKMTSLCPWILPRLQRCVGKCWRLSDKERRHYCPGSSVLTASVLFTVVWDCGDARFAGVWSNTAFGEYNMI